MNRSPMLALASLLATTPAWAQTATSAPAAATPPVTARAPGFADDATAGYPAGATWLADDLYTSQAATLGAAAWLLTPNHLLPGDQIGLRLATVAPSATGNGYAVGNTLTLTGGAVVTVATIAGGASTGPIATVTLASPAFHACANTAPGGLAQLATSGSGSGATFTGTFVGPYLYGARLLTVCYHANKAIDVQGAAAGPATIGFAADGLIDDATLDSLLAGARPSLLTVYDQGINGANGIQQTAYAGTLSPLRTIRGVRSLVMDGDIDGPLDSGAPGQITTINLPRALSVSNQANTLIFAGGIESLDHRTGLINVGYPSATATVGLYNKATAALPNIAMTNGAGVGTACPGMPFDRDNVIFAVSSATAETCTMNGVAGLPGSAPGPATDTAGNLGFTYDGQGFGYVDYDLAIVVPWAMGAAEVAAADASIQTTFGIQRQAHGVIVFDGDSISDAFGAPAQHGWVRMVSDMLARPDIRIVNTSFYGSTMGGGATNGAPGSRLAEQPLNVLPFLDTAYAQNAPDAYVVLNPMGNNDLNRGDSVATIESNTQAYCANVHAHHGRCVLTYFTGSTVGAYGSASYAAIAQWISANVASTGPGADIVVAIPPCPAGVACYQSDNLHPAPAGNWIMARAVVQALAPVLR
ncbi:MAG: SGNH/GDSL hydrolase family protein [Janthinobacterium lividum]